MLPNAMGSHTVGSVGEGITGKHPGSGHMQQNPGGVWIRTQNLLYRWVWQGMISVKTLTFHGQSCPKNAEQPHCLATRWWESTQ